MEIRTLRPDGYVDVKDIDYIPIPILDLGYVKLIDFMGKDESIIEAARMSTDGGFVSWDPYKGHPRGDMGLLSYLYEHKHHTPFEMVQMVIEVKAPIFVFREWHRHRTQSYNEMSGRYIPLPDENYMPEAGNILERALKAAANKQARGTSDRVPTEEEAFFWLASLDRSYMVAQEVYERGLEIGVPKELARLPVPVARYSRMRASANLRNWLAFLTLRMDPAAQWEIRMYANAVGSLIKQLFPRTWELFSMEKP